MLAASLDVHGGKPIRFGPDEKDAGDVPISISFGSEIPGGFMEGSIVLKRPETLSALDPNLFAAVRIYDEDDTTAYEGRVAGFPRQGATEIELDLEGHIAHLDDDGAARMIYRDLNLDNWQEPSTQRKLDLYDTGFYDAIQDFSAEAGPTMLLAANGSWSVGSICEAWYDAGPGLTVAEVSHTYTARNLDAAYIGRIDGADDIDGGGAVAGTDFVSGASSTGFRADTVGQRFAIALLAFVGASSGDADRDLRLTEPAVIGDHGLTNVGGGYFASDIVGDAISRWAPMLSTTSESIETSAFIIPHLVFREDTTARAIIEAVSLYGASGTLTPDWGVYEDREFFWRTPGTYGREWRVRRDEAVIPTDEGPTGDERCNGFKVSYQDGSGQSYTVGPPGSGSDYETADLADSSEDNPVNAAGIPSRIRSQDVGITSQAGAVLIGQLLLADANDKKRRGTVEITGFARDSAGNTFPAHQVRAGDTVIVEDDDDTSSHRIVSTDYAEEKVTAALDAPPHRVETLLARLAAANSAVGFF